MSALPFDGGHVVDEAHILTAPVDPSPAETSVRAMTSHLASRPDALLLIYADALDDFERSRIATENRVRSLRQVKGMGDTAEEVALTALVDGAAALEHGTELLLKRALRGHPLGPWIKRTIGVGEKQGARLLAAIGDPYWNSAADRPRRGPAELWAYCGYHVTGGHATCEAQRSSVVGDRGDSLDHAHAASHIGAVVGVAPRPCRGQKANWNAVAKMRAFLVAESCIKQRSSPYRVIYDAGRKQYTDALHAHTCLRCGPAGKPAQPGTPLSDGHKHARALRLVAKALLKDLWVEARRVRASSDAKPKAVPLAPDDLDAAQTREATEPTVLPSAPRDIDEPGAAS